MFRFHEQIARLTLIAVSLVSYSASFAQVSDVMRFDVLPYLDSSGLQHGDKMPVLNKFGETQLSPKYVTVVQSPGVNMMRIHFGKFNLGEQSKVYLTSLEDGDTQWFTHDLLVAWGGWSGIFKGDAVLVQLQVAPDEHASFHITQISVNDPPMGTSEGGIASLCGDDNRVSSTDPRVGRLSFAMCSPGNTSACGGCTAWLTSIGCAVSAGHCSSAPGGLIEFNVPPSTSNGTPNPASVNDQYPVGQTFYANEDHGTSGPDWAVMNVGPNSTGNAHWNQDYFHLRLSVPADETTLRITGYGLDKTPPGSGGGTMPGCGGMCNLDAYTQQTAIGSKTGSDSSLIHYVVDTEPANSGSPVMWPDGQFEFAIGVHTNGGCDSKPESNSGTRLSHPLFSQFLNQFLGGATFLDHAPVNIFEFGTALEPARTLPSAVDLSSSGGTIAIAGGAYTKAAGNTGTFNKNITLTAVSGIVRIGD